MEEEKKKKAFSHRYVIPEQAYPLIKIGAARGYSPELTSTLQVNVKSAS